MIKNSAMLIAIPAITFVCVEAILLIVIGTSITSLVMGVFSLATFAICACTIAVASRKQEAVFGMPLVTIGGIGFALQLIANIMTSIVGETALIPACVIGILIIGAMTICLISTGFAANHAQKIEAENATQSQLH